MVVARYNYPAQFVDGVDDVVGRIRCILLDGSYILGAEVDSFEEEFAEYCGSRFAVGVNSGTDALVLSLMALGVGPGDEVITQANTFYATVAAIRLVGAIPVLVDVDPATYQMNVEDAVRLMTSRTKAVIPVHLYGKARPLARLASVCRDNGCFLIEDAAQAHGAIVEGRKAGTFGTAGCFSFHPSKNLAAGGDGGAVVTDCEVLAARLRVLRSLGQDGQNHHVALGLNSKLDAIQAVVLRAKLRHLDEWNERRRWAAGEYRRNLTGLPLYFQDQNGADHVYHLFTVGCDVRDELLSFLRDHNVDAVVRYPEPIHRQIAFADCSWTLGGYPVAERLAAQLLCLPIRPDISAIEIREVCSAIALFFGRSL